MFVYNVKINGGKIFKYFFVGVILLLIVIVGVVSFKLFKGASNSTNSSDLDNQSTCIPQDNIFKITTSNYTNVLKTVHDNIDNYIGLKVNFIGYIYRVLDLNENQFVLARNMVISSDFKYVVVGFLCEYDKSKELQDGAWVELTGEITKGNYHGDIPIVKVVDIKEINKPNEEYVYPPDESYIPTSNIL